MRNLDKGLFEILGGKGSGNFGHSGGRGGPGNPGGSTKGGGKGRGRMSVSDYPEDASKITKEMRMAQAEYGDIQANMKYRLAGIVKGDPKLSKVDGELTKENVNKIIDNAKKQLGQYENYLAGDTAMRARDYIDHMKDVLSEPGLKNLNAKDIDTMMNDSIKKLVYQEVESNRQQFTDHGIRHIVGNIERQDRIMTTMTKGQVDPMDRLAGAFIMVNHDVGYTTPLIREGGTRGAMVSGNHKDFSEKILGQQADKWNEGKIFSREQYDKILHITKTHDSSDLDRKDPLGTSVRLSDNLSLFSKEKLPGMFQYVRNGEKHLLELGKAAAKKDQLYFEKAKTDLYSSIDRANISAQLKRDLKASVKELSYVTPKFTIGVLAGEISKISRSGGKTKVDITYSKWDARLQKMFDMGQRQTKKLLNDYGYKDFSKTEYDLGGIVTIKINGVK
jgi:hypothetical protein